MKGSAILKPIAGTLVLIAIASALFHWRMHGQQAHLRFDAQLSDRVETPTFLQDDPDKDKRTSDAMARAGVRSISVTFEQQKAGSGSMAFNVVARVTPFGHDIQGDPAGPVLIPVGAIGGTVPLPRFSAEVVPSEKPGANSLRVVTDAGDGDQNVLPVAAMVRAVIGASLDGYQVAALKKRTN